MKALILNGTERDDKAGIAAARAIADQLAAKGVHAVEERLAETEIAPCLGCFNCWTRTPGECVIDDPARGITARLIACDLLVILTRITFGGYSYHIKKLQDRSISLVLPGFVQVGGEIHHKARYERYPNILAVGILDKPGREPEKLFTALVERNAINMHSSKWVAVLVAANDSEQEMRRDISVGMGEVVG